VRVRRGVGRDRQPCFPHRRPVSALPVLIIILVVGGVVVVAVVVVGNPVRRTTRASRRRHVGGEDGRGRGLALCDDQHSHFLGCWIVQIVCHVR
jgi:hypothetical protein